MNRFFNLFFVLGLACLAALPAQATDQLWQGGAAGNPQAFGEVGNWTPGDPLAAGDNLQINTATVGLYPIISTDTNGQYPGDIGNLTVGSGTDDGLLEMISGALTVNGSTTIGSTTATGSTLAMTGGTFTHNTTGTMFIGAYGGKGALTLSGAGTAMNFNPSGSNIWVGSNGDGSIGLLSIDAGATLTSNSNIWVGASQTGSLTMNGGRLVCNGALHTGANGYGGSGNGGNANVQLIGDSIIELKGRNMTLGVNDNGTTGAYSVMTVDGTSKLIASFASDKVVFVGYTGAGSQASTLTFLDHSEMIMNSGSVVVGNSGSTGTLTFTGSSVFTQTSGNTDIGKGGVGNLVVTGSAQFLQNQPRSTGRFVLGQTTAGSVGHLTLGTLGGADNPTFTIAAVSAAVIGDANSTVTVDINTGTFNGNSVSGGGYTSMGFANSTVTWNQNGGLTNFPANSSPFIGCGNGAVVSLNLNGGVFAAPYIKTDTPNPTATVNMNFNGGTLKANGNDPNATFPFINVRSNGTFVGTVQAGGAVWDTNGFTNTMQYPLTHDYLGPEIDGGLTKLGFGKLLLTADSTYTGPTDVQAGELVLGNASTGSLATTAVTIDSGAVLTLNAYAPFTAATPSQVGVATNATLATKDVSGVYAYADVTFSDKSILSIACPYGSPNYLMVQKLSASAQGDRVIVDLPGLSSGGYVLTYTSKGDDAPTFITRTDGSGMVDLSLVDDGYSIISATVTDQSYSRGFRGQDSGLNPTGSWVNSQWWENGAVVASPSGGNARAWFNDNVLASTVHNVTLDTITDVTLSSLLFNGSYTIAKNSTDPAAIKLQSSIALDTQIQAVAGDSVVAPDIKMASGDPIITVADGASLTLDGVLSDLDPEQPAGLTVNGPGTLILNGANSYAGPTVLNSGTLKVGNAGAVGAASGVFTLAGGALSDAGANVALNKGFMIAGNATIAPENNLTITGSVAFTSGSLTKLGAGTATFNTPAVSANNFGSDLEVQAGTLALDGQAGTVYNVGVLNIAGQGNSSGAYHGAVAAMTVEDVRLTAANLITVGGYWASPDMPGTQPTGTLTLSGSAVAELGNTLYLGFWGGRGTVNVGTSAELTVHGAISVGYNWGDSRTTQVGNGEMNVNGHIVQDTAGSIRIGDAGGVGVWNQNAGLTETAAVVTLGQSDGNIAYGAGTLNLNGGTFQTPGIAAGNTTSGSAASTLATINFNGGTLKAAANNANFIANTTGATMTLNVLKNSTTGLGAVIDTNGHALTVNRPLVTGVTEGADGGLTKLGAGALTLSAVSSYTGPTTIDDGTVQLKTTPLVMHQEASTAVNAVGDRLDGPYALGRSFTANTAVQVTQLGVFDSGGDGLLDEHVVHLTNLDDYSDVTVTFMPGAGTYQNGFRFLDLDTPLSLNPTGNYKLWVASLGGGSGHDIFDEDVTTYDTGNGAITIGTYYWGYPESGEPTNAATANDTAASFIYYNPGGVIDANLLPVTTPVVMGGAAGSTPTLDLQGADQQVASLADVAGAEVFGVVTNSATETPVVLTLGATSGATTFNGSIEGEISLVKNGSSTQDLLGSLTYTSDTTVNAGTLNASSIDTPDSTVSVTGDGVLTASSITAATLTIGGARAPAAPVPEPSTFVLLALAGLGVLWATRRKA